MVFLVDMNPAPLNSSPHRSCLRQTRLLCPKQGLDHTHKQTSACQPSKRTHPFKKKNHSQYENGHDLNASISLLTSSANTFTFLVDVFESPFWAAKQCWLDSITNLLQGSKTEFTIHVC